MENNLNEKNKSDEMDLMSLFNTAVTSAAGLAFDSKAKAEEGPMPLTCNRWRKTPRSSPSKNPYKHNAVSETAR